MSYYLISLVVPMALAVMFAAAKRAQITKSESGDYLLEYAKALKYSAVIFSLLSLLGLLFLLFNIPVKTKADLITVSCMFIFWSLFTIYFYIEFFTVQIWVGETGIRIHSGWRGNREYDWNEITKIEYSPVTMWFIVNSDKQIPLRVSAVISGVDKFQQACRSYLAESIWLTAQNAFKTDKRNQ